MTRDEADAADQLGRYSFDDRLLPTDDLMAIFEPHGWRVVRHFIRDSDNIRCIWVRRNIDQRRDYYCCEPADTLDKLRSFVDSVMPANNAMWDREAQKAQ